MSAAWVAGAVRARAIAARRVGPAGARSLAASRDLESALARLSGGPYGRAVRPGQSLVQAQRAVAATVLWHGRVLAGWVPREGAQSLRVLLAWFEIANVDGLLDSFAGTQPPPPFRLGAMAIAWPRLARTRSRGELRTALASTVWGDPGGDDDRTISLALRLGWAARVGATVPAARRWAEGASALLVARELAEGRRPDVSPTMLRRAVGADVSRANDVDDLVVRLPRDSAWALGAARSLDELGTAEASWWAALESDAESLSRAARLDPDQVLATAALLAVDAWRVRAALGLAARGGRPLEAFDAVV